MYTTDSNDVRIEAAGEAPAAGELAETTAEGMSTENTVPMSALEELGVQGVSTVPVAAIRAAASQARKVFDAGELKALADSIRTQGLLQPVVLRAVATRAKKDLTQYELVVGERRWRAAKLAGLTHIPAIVKVMDDEQALIAGLVENLQRANLSPIEEGEAFHNALMLPGYTYRRLGEKLGIAKVHKGYIEERVRAYRSAPDIREMIRKRPDTLTHARVIAAIKDKEKRAAMIAATLQGASLAAIRAALKTGETKLAGGSEAAEVMEGTDMTNRGDRSDIATSSPTEGGEEVGQEGTRDERDADIVDTAVASIEVKGEHEEVSGRPDTAEHLADSDGEIVSADDEAEVFEDEESENEVTAVCLCELSDLARRFREALQSAVVPSDPCDVEELWENIDQVSVALLAFQKRLVA